MKQKLTLRRVLASAVAALAAAAAVWLLCRWVGYDLQLRIGNEPVYEIANDDYTQVIDVPEDGLWQAVPLEAGQTLYGCRLRFSTHGELYRAGMVMVDLCDADGTILREAAGNYANIFDDNFTGFAFGTAYTAAQAETLHLHIYNVVEWEGPLGLWASTGTVGALALTADGVDADATLALQYMTDDTGSWPSDLANGLAPLLAFAAFAAVLLFGLRAPLPLTVAVVGLACGLLFVRVTPVLVAPDEYTHLAAAYEMASRLGGETPADENGCLLVRESDAPHFDTRSGEIGILAYKAEALARQKEAGGSDALTAVSEAKAGQGSGNYLPQALGIRLARNVGANFYTMLRQARTFNLIFYLLLAVLAVALAPAAVRGLLACIALLPMPLQLAGSLSPDASVLGMVFCYTALCLRLRTKKAVRWEKILLIALGGAVGPAKAIYLPVVLLCFIIPADNLVGPTEFVRGSFGARVRSGQLIREAVLVLAGCLWLSANLGELAYAARDTNQMLLAVGAVGIILLLALTRRLYEKVQNDAKKLRLFKGGLACAVVLAVLGGAVGPAKAIYLPVVLLCFIIPADNLVGSTEFVRGSFGARVRSGQLIREAVLVLAGCLWLSANLGELAYAARDMNRMLLAVGAVGVALLLALVRWLYGKVQNDAKKLRLFKGALACAVVLAVVGGVLALSRMGGGLAPDQLLMTNPNGDSIWTFSLGYICRNLPATAKLLLRTIPAQGALWLQGILGTTLGEPIVYRIDVSWLLGVGLVLALLAAALPVQDEPDEPLLGRRTGFGVLGIILCVAAASLVVALNWTPINYETLFGMQGRYWLPVLPLALLLVKENRSVCARRDLSRGAALAVTACTLLTLLQGYSLYASWQPVS